MNATEWITTSGFLKDLRNFDNKAAWDRFVDFFRPAILAFARRMGVRESESEDAAQEVLLAFTDAYCRGRYDRAKGSLRKWLFVIAFHRVVDMRRRKRNAPEVFPLEIENGPPDLASIEESWDREWYDLILRRGLSVVRSEVRSKTYEAFELVVIQGRSVESVMDALGLSRNAVYLAKFKILRRLEALRQKFEDESS